MATIGFGPLVEWRQQILERVRPVIEDVIDSEPATSAPVEPGPQAE